MRSALFWVIMQQVVVFSYRRYPETSVKIYYYSLCNDIEERSSQTCIILQLLFVFFTVEIDF